MITFLFLLTYESFNFDLASPFLQTRDRKINDHELGGAAYIANDYIVLLPGLQFHSGSVWTTLQFPENFDTTLTFQIPSANGYGETGFGIWFVDTYGIDGRLHGGPRQFSVFGLLFSIDESPDDHFKLNIRLVEDQNQDTGINLQNHKTLPKILASPILYKSDLFDIRLSVSFKKVTLSIGLNNVFTELSVFEIKQPILHKFFGVTAQTFRFISSINLIKIAYQTQDSSPIQKRYYTNRQRIPEQFSHPMFSPPIASHFRSPLLGVTSNYVNKSIKESDLNDLFNVVHEITLLSTTVAKYSDLTSFISTTFLPVANKWQQRSLKVVDRVMEIKNIAETALFYSQKIASDLQSTLAFHLNKTDTKISNIYEVILDEAQKGIDKGDQFKNLEDDYAYRNVSLYLFYLSVFEAITFVVAIILVNITPIQKFILRFIWQ